MQLSVARSQKSLVQATLSLQLGAPVEMQPSSALQVSTPSHAIPLSQAALIGACEQLFAASSQASAVQEVPSSQLGGAPGWQTPPAISAQRQSGERTARPPLPSRPSPGRLANG